MSQISKICEVPLIISGGLGNLDHIKEVLKKKVKFEGIASAKALHYNDLSINDIKKILN